MKKDTARGAAGKKKAGTATSGSNRGNQRTQKKTTGNRATTATGEDAADSQSAHRQTGQSNTLEFPVVGIGASAGGLEALEILLDNMPTDTGMAFVIVTHQHPGHTSLLPELLGRETEMPVVQATDNIKLQPNHVYVGPPGQHLAILDGTLHLLHTETRNSPRLPIDHFFRSLAQDQHHRAIGIVLSGTGSDGSIGLKTIKAEAGMVIAQEPQSAKFEGMPSSAIATGLVDYVLPPAAIPGQLVAYARGPYLQRAAVAQPPPVIAAEPMHKIFLLLRGRTGHDFSAYKISTIRRRIERRMNVHQIDEPSQYVRYLQEYPHEIDVLFKELLISVTAFFRDREAWEALVDGPLPELLKSRPENDALRAWIPGCATGEEVYSLIILLHECGERIHRPFDVKVFGTDLDSDAIETARLGRYPDGVAADVTPERLDRYFLREDGHYRIRQEIRDMAVFAPQNVIKDPPFTKLDILCCRNLLIYLNADLQKRLLPIFHYALKPGGLLFLGPSETIGGFTDLFEPLDKRWKIFRRQETATIHPVEIPAALAVTVPEANTAPEADADLKPAAAGLMGSPSRTQPVERLIERLMLARYCPATVVVNGCGDIIHIHGRTGAYFEPAEGQPRMNALAMAREGLQIELASALRQAAADGKEVVREQVRVKTNSEYSFIDFSVVKISEPEAIRGLLLVSFRPATPPEETDSAKQRQDSGQEPPALVDQLRREVEHLIRSQQTMREELETANEELKSTNEELQSTNEELQSSNEELETSKEELQSLNEELSTVNSELQSNVEDFALANDDMQNLLNSVDVATLFLDNDLNIRRYTESTTGLIKLRESDIGRPLEELATNLRSGRLAEECRQVLRSLTPLQQEITSSDGVWYLLRIRPYRTTQNVIDGVVVTFVNIDELKRARESAELRTYFENLFETVRHPLIVLDEHLRVVSANPQFCRTFGVRAKQAAGSLLYEVGGGEWDIPELRELLEEILPKNKSFEDFEVEHEFRQLGRQRLLLNARRVEQAAGLPGLILLGVES